MVVKQVFDHSLRAYGKRFISSLKVSNRYSASYLDSLERTIALAALFSEERRWPPVRGITTAHIEEYLAYLRERPRWFGTRESADPQTVSQGYIDAQYRRLNRFFNWLVERGHVESNPLRLINRPHVDERTVPVVSEREVLDLLTLLDPALARTPAHRFRLARNRAVLYLLWDAPGRRNEIAMLGLGTWTWTRARFSSWARGGGSAGCPLATSPGRYCGTIFRPGKLSVRCSALWVSEHGEAMEPGWLYLMLKRLGKRAGISGLHTHRFRHSYAMNALRNGMPERVLEMIGGWRKIPDTYFRTLGAEDARQFHKQVSPGDRLGRASAARKSSRQRSQGKPRGRL